MELSDSLGGFVSWRLPESFPHNVIQSLKCGLWMQRCRGSRWLKVYVRVDKHV